MAASAESRASWAFPLVISVLVILVTSLPYAIGIATQESSTSRRVVQLPGLQRFLAMMRQGAAGSWLYRLAYTSEPHAGAAIYGFWLALGHAAGALQVEPASCSMSCAWRTRY